MYPLNETPSPVVLFALVVIAGVAAFLFRRGSVLEVGAIAAFSAALAHTIFEMVIRGFGPLFVIGIGLTFLFYLPIAVAMIWIIRRARQQSVKGG
jgi:hypothetical protein